MTTDPAITAAYEACRRLQRRHDPTYYWATRRLPAEVRPATHALYGYVRTADEIVDGPRRPATAEARRAALDAWEHELQRGPEAHPIVSALLDAAERHDLPLEELGIYMGSMRVDCDRVRIGSDEELDVYMDGSAGSVGRIMAPLLGVPERFHADFGRLGQAFQLTNFIRDVDDDWALDRIYLPGVDDLRTPALRDVVVREIQRARSLFAAAEPAVAAAPRSVRAGIRLASAAYLRILDRAEAAGGDVLGRRVGVRVRDWPAIAAAGRR